MSRELWDSSLNYNEEIMFVVLTSMSFAEKRDMHSELKMIKSRNVIKIVSLQQFEYVQSGHTDLSVCRCVLVYRYLYNIRFPPPLPIPSVVAPGGSSSGFLPVSLAVCTPLLTLPYCGPSTPPMAGLVVYHGRKGTSRQTRILESSKRTSPPKNRYPHHSSDFLGRLNCRHYMR